MCLFTIPLSFRLRSMLAFALMIGQRLEADKEVILNVPCNCAFISTFHGQ